jgi:hypothetical protein
MLEASSDKTDPGESVWGEGAMFGHGHEHAGTVTQNLSKMPLISDSVS